MMNYINEKGAAGDKITVELQDLDWEDRERILRLLFSKMNTGESAADWRESDQPPEEEEPEAKDTENFRE